MKKIISLLAVVTMLSTAFAVPTYAASVTMTAEATEVDVSEYYTHTRGEISADEYTAYKVTVDYSNIGTVKSEITNDGWDDVFGGRQLTLQDCKLQFSSLENVHVATTQLSNSSITGRKPGQWNTTDKQYVVTASGDTYYYPGLTSTTTTVSDKIDDALIMYFAVKKGATVNVKLVDGTLCFNECANSTITGANEGYSLGEENITLVGEFTLGETAPAKFKFTEGTYVPVTADGVNGYIIAGNKMENVDNTATYVATFTAGPEGAKETKTSTLKLLPESLSTFTFDAVLRFKGGNVKENIKLEVAAAE